ncbi:PqqD family protein [Streptomyces kronopolitis]|uniref:PqqD family protein n=1 Tax=Streptomyces kronopolitis TaxID=1612435 RepID=UPI00367FBFD1
MLTTPSQIHWAHCADDTAVLDLRSGQWQMLSGTGTRIWDAIMLRGGVEGLAEEIAVPANLDLAATRHAVDSYVERLRAMGLLVEAGPRMRRRWWGRRR